MQFEDMKLINCDKTASIPALLPMLVALATLLTGQTANAAEEDIYKAISNDGTTAYSDKPSANSTTVAPLVHNVLTIPAPVLESPEAYGEESDSPRLTVTSVKITSLINDQTIINPRGPIPVSIATAPEAELPEGYTAKIKMDGEIVSSGDDSLLSIPSQDRGTHTVEAIVLDASGTVQASSSIVTIHIRRSTVRREE